MSWGRNGRLELLLVERGREEEGDDGLNVGIERFCFWRFCRGMRYIFLVYS